MDTGFLTHRDCARHEMGSWHPEAPERLAAIQDQIISSGIDPHLVHIEAPPATIEMLQRAHSAEYLAALQARIPDSGYASLDPDTYANPDSWRALLRAAGAVVEATNQVVDGRLRNAFCAVRPPGHHARHAAAMGFCLVNNIAVGARHALEVRGLKRVAIVDFDVHHGNGTEDIFAGDERVLMVSFFQHPFYPYTGAENPANNMVNVPLPAGTRGDIVREMIETTWIPRLESFAPEMIFLCAGFDAHREDDLGQMGLVEDDFRWITERMMRVADQHADGRIVSSLEGGYNLSSLARSVTAHVRALAQL